MKLMLIVGLCFFSSSLFADVIPEVIQTLESKSWVLNCGMNKSSDLGFGEQPYLPTKEVKVPSFRLKKGRELIVNMILETNTGHVEKDFSAWVEKNHLGQGMVRIFFGGILYATLVQSSDHRFIGPLTAEFSVNYPVGGCVLE